MLGDKLTERLPLRRCRRNVSPIVSIRITVLPAKFSPLSHIRHGILPCLGFQFVPDLGENQIDLAHITTILDPCKSTRRTELPKDLDAYIHNLLLIPFEIRLGSMPVCLSHFHPHTIG